MNNPFAPTAAPPAANTNPFGAPPAPAPAAQASANPFAPGAVVLNPGVQAIQAAFQAPAAATNPFAPLNPPGEAGLGLAAAVVAQPEPAPVEPVVAPDEPAPRARRGRKPKAAETHVDEQGGTHSSEEAAVAGDFPGESDTVTPSDPRNPTRGYSLDEQLAFATTEELVAQLKTRGYAVTLTDGAP